MTTEESIPLPPQTPGFKMIRTLGAIAMLSGLLVVLVFQYTKPIIAENQRIAIENAVTAVVPGARSQLEWILGADGLVPAGSDIPGEVIYAAFDDKGRLKGIALAAGAQGYQDIVKLLYGYDPDCQCVRGIKILKMTETPGLGDKIAFDPAFLANFEALDATLNASGEGLANRIHAVKHGRKSNAWEIDAISGATISSVAVANAINRSLQQAAPVLQRELARLKAGAQQQAQRGVN
jgi:electron transport complex protein RnfG